MMDIQKAIGALSAAANSSASKNWSYTPYVKAVLAHIAELQQRIDKAEAQLAELANQEPVEWTGIPFTFKQLKAMHGKDFARGYNAG